MGPALITIRPFGLADIGAAAAMEAACRPRPWTESVFKGELSAEGRVYLVAEGDALVGFGAEGDALVGFGAEGDALVGFGAEGDALVGFAGAAVVGEEAHVTNLLVDPAHRGKGVGRRLMIALISAAVAEGARHTTLEVRSSGAAALSLYSRLGFAPAGARRNYYGDDDALVMRARDVDSAEYAESLR